MWTCKTCREKIDDTESACPTCGVSRPDPADFDASTATQTAGNKLLSIIVVCVVIAVLLAIAFWK